MSQELIERIEKFRERGCDTETHVLLCDCRDELTKQADQIGTLRMQLAACDVAALQNTRESLETRIPKDNPYYSAAYRSVCDAVDREIAHREGCTKQAERLKALEGLVEFFYGQMYMTSPKMNGQHTYRFRSGGWPMTHCVGPTAEAAVEAVMKEIEREKQDQIDRAAVLKEGERKPSIDVIAEMAKHEDGGISVGGLMGDQCGVCGIGFCVPSGRCDHCNAVLRKGET